MFDHTEVQTTCNLMVLSSNSHVPHLLNTYQHVLGSIHPRGKFQRDSALKIVYIRRWKSSYVITKAIGCADVHAKDHGHVSYPAPPTLAQRLSGNSSIHGSGSILVLLMTQLVTLQVLMSDTEARNCWRARKTWTNKQRREKGSLSDITLSDSLQGMDMKSGCSVVLVSWDTSRLQ